MIIKNWIPLFLLLNFSACDNTDKPLPSENKNPLANNIELSIDKAYYSPSEVITFSASQAVPSTAKIRYKHLDRLVAENSVNGNSWTWTAPSSDYSGYIAELYDVVNGEEKILATIGIDVSSNWTRFPRYGFLSKFPQMSDVEIQSVIKNLNRHHINGIQYYDWHYKHHQPLAGTPTNPQAVYKDIINRDIYFATVEKYIHTAKQYNIKSMFYNLIFGALKDAANDGVSEQWYLFTDQNKTNKDKHSLPQPPFISDIYLVNPANEGWQNYLINENRKVYEALPFDGFHIDQLGNRGNLYDYHGNAVDLTKTYKPFMEAVKADQPAKHLVMNAVDQYGQAEIAQSPVGFLYTEVWSANSYGDLANVIKENNSLSNHTKNTVLAAYMNYNLADNTGFFNTPSVLLTDAVIFAFGGSHLELGEHMLGKEYFPNNNLMMKEDLKKALVHYYDFMVAYQNLLRDGGTFNNPNVTNYSFDKFSLSPWPAQMGKVSVVGKAFDDKQVIHLLNFTDATTISWRDNQGVQAYPFTIKNLNLKYSTNKTVKKVWLASPDINMGASEELAFSQTGDLVTFIVPSLQFWDMIVVEYQ